LSFEFGYNTNGFAHHRLTDAIDILAEIGYSSVALTLDHHALDPFSDGITDEVTAIHRHLQQRNLSCVIETGARYLLDPERRHWPTLLTANSENRQRRFDFLCRAMRIAARLDADAVSFWSGAADPALSEDESWALLIEACDALLARAVQHDVWLAFEPEPGMFIETMAQFRRLSEALNHPRFGLTLDVGHVHCLGDGEPAQRVREFAHCLLNVHLEDMKAGEHAHLMFGDGEIAFEPIFEALADVQYLGSVNVELSRHSHIAVDAARQAFGFLSRYCAHDA
jgi:L-ribulose-5-phosphate 3-epimerase